MKWFLEKSDFREHLNRTKTIFRRNRIDALCAVRFQRPLVVPIVSLWSFTVLFFCDDAKKKQKLRLVDSSKRHTVARS